MKITAAELFERLEPVIRVGPYDIAIVPWDAACQEEAGADAWFSSEYEEICIGPMLTCARLVTSLIHELIHAIYWLHDAKDKTCEEQIATWFGQDLTQIYRDNPWFLEWVRIGLEA